MTLDVHLDCDGEPLREGWPQIATLRVRNTGKQAVALDRCRIEGNTVRWRRRLAGAVVYDATQDCYRQTPAKTVRSPVQVCQGVIPPGRSQESMVQVRLLEPGRREVTLRTTFHVIPQPLGQVYVMPADRLKPVVTIPALTEESQLEWGELVVRTSGPPQEATHTAAVEITADADHPASLALEGAGQGAQLLGRCRRLGGAWVVRAADGSVHVSTAERSLTAYGLDPQALLEVDRDASPFDPVLVMFEGERARALREAGGLPVEPGRAQQALPPEAVWDLLTLAEERCLRVAWGWHTVLNEGLIVRE